MKRKIKIATFFASVVLFIACFAVFSYAQTARRAKKPAAAKRQNRQTNVRASAAADREIAVCLACFDKPKPEIYPVNPKTSQKIIVSDCEPMNLKTIYQPKVSYPKAAQSVGAFGTVKVDVVFDETGKTLWAKVVEGHPLLQAEALRIACLTRIKPPVSCFGQPRKANTITYYNFMPER